jgi:hypothetical protein
LNPDFSLDWGHVLMVLLFGPSVVLLPALLALRLAIGRRGVDSRVRAGIILHGVAILLVAAWFVTAMRATSQDVSAGGAYVFLGFIVLMPLNGILAVAGSVMMLLDRREKTASEPPPLP